MESALACLQKFCSKGCTAVVPTANGGHLATLSPTQTLVRISVARREKPSGPRKQVHGPRLSEASRPEFLFHEVGRTISKLGPL